MRHEAGDLPGERLGGVEDVGMAPEPVHLTEVARADDAHVQLGEAPDEQLALVAQRVALGGDHQRGRQGGEPVGEQRRQVGVGEVGGRGGVLLPVPGGLARVEPDVGQLVGLSRPAGRGTGRSAPTAANRPGCAARRPGRGCRRRCRRARTSARRARGRCRRDRASASTVSTSSGAAGKRCSGGRPVVDAEHRHPAGECQPACRAVVHVDVVEDEAAAVQVHEHAWPGTVGPVEPHGTPSASRSCTSATGTRGSASASSRASRRAPSMSSRARRPGSPLPSTRRRAGLRVQRVSHRWPSRASSSSTTAGSSLVNTGVGLATGVPGHDRAALPAGGAGVVAGEDRVARSAVEVVDLLELRHRLHLARAAEDDVDGVGRERQERREDRVQVGDALRDARAGSCRAARARRRP